MCNMPVAAAGHCRLSFELEWVCGKLVTIDHDVAGKMLFYLSNQSAELSTSLVFELCSCSCV